MNDNESSYAAAGVDIEAGERAVEQLKPFAEKARRPEVLGGIGGFAGLFALKLGRYTEPVLAAPPRSTGCGSPRCSPASAPPTPPRTHARPPPTPRAPAPVRRRPDDLDEQGGGRFPALPRPRPRGARVTDIDGHEYIDFASATPARWPATRRQPTVDASRTAGRRGRDHGDDARPRTRPGSAPSSRRRFGPPLWSFTLTATDANRWAIRLARQVTGRPKILVYSYCYHGSVDEVVHRRRSDGPRSRARGTSARRSTLRAPRASSSSTTSTALERELAHGDVAAVLMEPALTNIGIVLPDPGYLDGVRELTRRDGTLLINDETHTFSAGPGRLRRAPGASSRTSSRSASRSPAASRSAPTA